MNLLVIVSASCFILNACGVVQGCYFVQVRLNGYSNPTGRCQDCPQIWSHGVQLHSCCNNDRQTNCSDYYNGGCDSYFIYCLRPLGDSRLTRCQSNESTKTSSINRGDSRVRDFSQDMVLDLDNPLKLSGLGDSYKGIQLFIMVRDVIFGWKGIYGDQLVDILQINHDQQIGLTLQQNYTGIYDFVTMNLTITVFCEGNFGGSNCAQCTPGFTGPNCSDIDYCFGVHCSGNGECNNEHFISNNSDNNVSKCTCDSGYKGELCEQIDCRSNRCSGNGVCVDSISDPPSCNCSAGFTGRVCDINIGNMKYKERDLIIAMVFSHLFVAISFILLGCVIHLLWQKHRRSTVTSAAAVDDDSHLHLPIKDHIEQNLETKEEI